MLPSSPLPHAFHDYLCVLGLLCRGLSSVRGNTRGPRVTRKLWTLRQERASLSCKTWKELWVSIVLNKTMVSFYELNYLLDIPAWQLALLLYGISTTETRSALFLRWKIRAPQKLHRVGLPAPGSAAVGLQQMMLRAEKGHTRSSHYSLQITFFF